MADFLGVLMENKEAEIRDAAKTIYQDLSGGWNYNQLNPLENIIAQTGRYNLYYSHQFW